MSARSYAGAESIVVEVVDPVLPDNTTRLRISRDGTERTNRSASASIDVAALSAAYLGGVRWWQLAQAGRLGTVDTSSVNALDTLFAVPSLPHSGTMF